MKRIIFTSLIFTFTLQLEGQVLSQGPSEPSTVGVQNLGCLACTGTDWNNPANAGLTDSLYAQTSFMPHAFCFQSSCYYSRELMPHGYGFTIPSNAIILGIRADVLRKEDSIFSVLDTIVQLYSNNSAQGINKANPFFWTDSATWISYGDSTDLWGTNFTPADINLTDFGLIFSALNKSSSGNISAYVDDIRITVWYQIGNGIVQYQSSSHPYQIYYDQATQILHIKNNSGNEKAILEITSENGQLLKSEEINLNKETRTIIDLPSGIFAVRILCSDNYFTKKIIVER